MSTGVPDFYSSRPLAAAPNITAIGKATMNHSKIHSTCEGLSNQPAADASGQIAMGLTRPMTENAPYIDLKTAHPDTESGGP